MCAYIFFGVKCVPIFLVLNLYCIFLANFFPFCLPIFLKILLNLSRPRGAAGMILSAYSYCTCMSFTVTCFTCYCYIIVNVESHANQSCGWYTESCELAIRIWLDLMCSLLRKVVTIHGGTCEIDYCPIY